jgi:hypothetical protein
MKLYAKTKSNRAEKGQGGDYLAIEITGENKQLLWHIFIENNRLDLSEWDNIQHKAKLILRTFKNVEKGKH